MLEEWIKEIKAEGGEVGMMLVHNGIVRQSSKDGRSVKGMRLAYDRRQLESTLKDFKNRDGIFRIKVWINEGDLKVGDDIMYVLVAGRFRTDVMPVFENLITRIKKDVVVESEI
ncbi:MAG: molybdenum cofactor biosynthesis protein MoaE [Nitrospirae bacterium]|nr:molybdenum cofactor biosynthesis protein MoaE [Nitrospirota bacterium]